MDETLRKELIKKYQWAGKIRLVTFFLLFIFLFLMKAVGGYAYFNLSFVVLIFVEAILNQPYPFFLARVNLYRFQFYQMATDIIVISWILYYLGGIEAPVVSIAYYAVILWAGLVSGQQAVFFAVGASSIFFSLAVILEHSGILPHISYFNYRIPTAQMLSLLLGNLAFLFAFGYFCSHSSRIIKSLERKRQEEALKYTHRLIAAGYLLSALAHNIINHLASMRGYAEILWQKLKCKDVTDAEADNAEMHKRMQELGAENIELFSRLSRFSRRQKEKIQPVDLNKVVEDVLGLTLPLLKVSAVIVEKTLGPNLPLVLVDKEQIQEVLVTLILNSWEAMSQKGALTIRTSYLTQDKTVHILISDTGLDLKQDYFKKRVEPFFSAEGQGGEDIFSFALAEEIVTRYKGKIDIERIPDKGRTVAIKLPALLER